jgi:NADH:ubiquinone oxidoreductase subunit 2 (subunit N)
MMTGLTHAHSGLRYIVLLMLLVAIFNAFAGIKSGNYLKKDKMINLFAMVFLHIQLLLGLVLYFISDKVKFAAGVMEDKADRFFTVEHIAMMLLAIILITLGRKKAEKQHEAKDKHKFIVRYYVLGLVLIFIAIPWPFIYPYLGLGYF